jgi:hypothetical protein
MLMRNVPWFDYDESFTWRGLNSNSGHFCGFTFNIASFGELRLLVSLCTGGRCSMVSNDEDHDRSRGSSAENRGWSYRLGTR